MSGTLWKTPNSTFGRSWKSHLRRKLDFRFLPEYSTGWRCGQHTEPPSPAIAWYWVPGAGCLEPCPMCVCKIACCAGSRLWAAWGGAHFGGALEAWWNTWCAGQFFGLASQDEKDPKTNRVFTSNWFHIQVFIEMSACQKFAGSGLPLPNTYCNPYFQLLNLVGTCELW